MSADVASILALVEERRRALMEQDLDALARMLDHGFRYVDSLGRELPREAYLKSRASGELRIESQNLKTVRVALLGADHALVTLTTDEVISFRGERSEVRFRVVHLCVRAQGMWKFLFGQSTSIEVEGGST